MLGIIATVLAAGPAMAANDGPAYRYWAYWIAASGEWQFAPSGPAARAPQDGEVEGWRFAVTTAAGDQPPRADPSGAFASACGATAAAPGMKRIAIVIDPGTTTDAPPGQSPGAARMACALIPIDATSAIALGSVSDVRADAGLVCGLDGYPSGECAPVVSASTATSTATSMPTSAPTATPMAAATSSSTAPMNAASTPTAPGTSAGDSPGALPTLVSIAVVIIAIVVIVVLRRRRARR